MNKVKDAEVSRSQGGKRSLGQSQHGDSEAETVKASKKRRLSPVSTKPTDPAEEVEAAQAQADSEHTGEVVDHQEENDSDSGQNEDVKSKLDGMRKYFEQTSNKSSETASTSKAGASPKSNQSIQESDNKAPSPAFKASWNSIDTLLVYTSQGVCSSSKIAGFDIDGTIIGTKSGRVFPTDTSDWQILLPEIPGRLKQLTADGYKVVFFSNQMGIEKKKVGVNDFKKKVENIVAKLNIPIQAFISTGVGRYRKPGLGMWKYLLEKENGGVAVNYSESFFVGDAAGRPQEWAPKKKKDFSCGDRLFAMNAGLAFHTPEEFFKKSSKAKFTLPAFDPKAFSASGSLLSPASSKLPLGSQEVLVLVGSPASGKSHFVEKQLLSKGYVHVNRDTLKTWQKCVQATKDALSKGKSVVVDNTNPDVESRKRYVDVAKAAGASCRCFVMATSLDQARHNERFREMTNPKHEPISEMVFNMYKSKFTEPTLKEGFSEIVRVNQIPDFNSAEDESLYRQFLLEK